MFRFFICIFFMPALVYASARETPIVLHFDINGTICAKDSAAKRSHHAMICEAFAKRLYDTWPLANGSISKKMSFREYVFTKQFSNDPSDRQVKQKRITMMSAIFDYLEKWEKPYAKDVRQSYKLAMKELSDQKSLLLPSFIQLIRYLQHTNRPFFLHLHTFGSDLSTVKKAIYDELNVEFEKEYSTKKMQISLDDEGSLHKAMSTLYDSFFQSNVTVHYDYQLWNSHREGGRYGKLIPMDLSRKGKEVFFDDNLLRLPSHRTSCGALYSLKDRRIIDAQTAMSTGYFIHVDLIEAVLNRNYYIQKLKSSNL